MGVSTPVHRPSARDEASADVSDRLLHDKTPPARAECSGCSRTECHRSGIGISDRARPRSCQPRSGHLPGVLEETQGRYLEALARLRESINTSAVTSILSS